MGVAPARWAKVEYWQLDAATESDWVRQRTVLDKYVLSHTHPVNDMEVEAAGGATHIGREETA